MKYLVVASEGPGFVSPEETLEALQGMVLPSFQEIARLEKSKKIVAGGLPVGERAMVFIADAKNHDELDAMLREIPMWGALEWEVTPLQSFAARARHERAIVREIKQALRGG